MLKFGGITYPIAVPGDGNSLARLCDPFQAIYLEFAQTVINHYCAAALKAVLKLGSRRQGREACEQTTALPPELYLRAGYQFPLLALYPEKDGPAENRTLRWKKTTTLYRLDYVLPPFTEAEAERALPLLQAVRRLLVETTARLHDPSYNSGEDFQNVAGIEQMRFLGADYGMLGNPDNPRLPHVLSMQLEVVHREDVDLSDAVPLDRIALTVQSVGETQDPTASFEVLSYSDTDPEA